MNRYQVILPPHGDIVAIKADRAYHDTKNQVLCFYDDTKTPVETVAQFCNWYGWNLLGPVEEAKTAPKSDHIPVCGFPTGLAYDGHD